MTLPMTMTAGELADEHNPQAHAVWIAVQRGEARVMRAGFRVRVIGISWKHNELQLKITDTLSDTVTPDTVLHVERLV